MIPIYLKLKSTPTDFARLVCKTAPIGSFDFDDQSMRRLVIFSAELIPRKEKNTATVMQMAVVQDKNTWENRALQSPIIQFFITIDPLVNDHIRVIGEVNDFTDRLHDLWLSWLDYVAGLWPEAKDNIELNAKAGSTSLARSRTALVFGELLDHL